MALINSEDFELEAKADVSEAKWFSVKKVPNLAFDHGKILKYALKRLRWKFEYTTVAFSLLPKNFSISELRAIYQIVFDRNFDKRNFNKKILSLDILGEEGIRKEVSYRPPMLYSLKKGVGDIVDMI
jgi:8-oxo-dGTP diphosphatase